MIGRLPQELEVGGKLLPIRTDFRDVLNLFPMFDDPELTELEKSYVACRNLYKCEISPEDFDEAVDKIYWFIDGGDIPKDDPAPVRIIDWQKDERTIMPAISKTVGVPDVRSLPYMHWFTFLGAFGEMGEGLFSTVLNLRRKIADGEKLDEWERKWIQKNKDLVVIHTKEEEEAIAETEAFLKDLLKDDY
jgi:hypothetical protein